MKKTITAITAASTLLMGLTAVGQTAYAANWSSSKVEVLYGQNFKRGPNGADQDEATFTFANATGFDWGDSFIFADVNRANKSENTGGTHLEFSTRYNVWKAADGGIIKGAYGIVQGDMTSNKFVSKIVPMGGASLDWAVPGFKFFKTHLQYRDDPTLDGSSVQFNLVWNSEFKLGEQQFSFEGFADWTSGEGTGNETNFLMQPQLLWHVNKSVAVGVEYQYWKNRLGIDGRDESVPQVMVRWTF